MCRGMEFSGAVSERKGGVLLYERAGIGRSMSSEARRSPKRIANEFGIIPMEILFNLMALSVRYLMVILHKLWFVDEGEMIWRESYYSRKPM